MCVAVASVQSIINIPVFSTLFSSGGSSTSQVLNNDKPYIKSIEVDFKEHDLKYKLDFVKEINFNKYFNNYTSIIVRFTNVKTSEIVYSGIIPKGDLGKIGYPCFDYDITGGSAQYKIEILCTSLHPEELIYDSYIIKDETTFYLIYTHGELINV